MNKIYTLYLFSLGFFAFLFAACNKKEALLPEIASYAKSPYFINNSILSKVGIRYQEQAQQTVIGFNASTRVLSGTKKYTFYNKNTGAVLLEKTFDSQPNKRIDTLYFFQPDSAITPQLIKNTQINEPAAPAGYMKLKIANLSKVALTNAANVPYPKLDLIITANLVGLNKYDPYDTLMSVGPNLDTASYYLVKKAFKAGAQLNGYRFSFIDHDTKQLILNSGGTRYETATFNTTSAGKNVYTFYLSDFDRTANAANILKNNKYYGISINALF